MPQFSDRFVMKTARRNPKKSTRGRKKTRFFKLIVGDSWVQLDPERAAEMAGVSVKTVYHWINGTKTPSPQVQMLMEIRAGGMLPWSGWEGWRLLPDSGRLCAPNGYSFMPGELAWWSLEKALRSELQRENAALRVQVEQLRAQVQEQAANNIYHFPRAKNGRGHGPG